MTPAIQLIAIMGEAGDPSTWLAQQGLPHPRTQFGRLTSASKIARTELARAALVRLGFDQNRSTPLTKLPVELNAAATLLDAFSESTPSTALNHTLDSLSPLQATAALVLLRTTSTVWWIATHSPFIAERCDEIRVVRGPQTLFQGTPGELARQAAPSTVTANARNTTTLQSMAAPFRVEAKLTRTTAEFTTPQGQELAATLLKQGYGEIERIIVQEPELIDGLRAVLTGESRAGHPHPTA